MTGFLMVFMVTYLLGSLSFAYLAGRLRGRDLRCEGSGNLGAKNVQRVLGSFLAVIVLALDVFKGGAAVLVAMALSGEGVAPLVGWLGVVCGHGWPLFLRFKGGKGLASSAGAMLVISPVLLVAELLVGFIMIIISRNVYVASIVMAAFLPVMVQTLKGSATHVAVATLIAAVIILLHKKNIRRLRREFQKKYKK